MTFHQARLAKPIVNSHPANQNIPAQLAPFIFFPPRFLFSLFPRLPFQKVDIVHIYIRKVPVYCQDYCHTNGHFRGGYDHHKDGEDLAGQQPGDDIAGKRYEADIHRIKHDLDAHQDNHGVAPGQGAVKADTKQYRR